MTRPVGVMDLALRGRRVREGEDVSDLGWYERMARRAARREGEERERVQGPWRRFCEERGGTSGGVADGMYLHYHWLSHGNGTYDAATRQFTGGVATVVIGEDPEPMGDEHCPICRDFPTFEPGVFVKEKT